MSEFGIEGKVAVVTGGGIGIGAATCRTLAAHGADVVVADKEPERTAALAEELRASGRRALGVVADLTTAEGMTALVDAALGEFGAVDILVNNLGHHLSAAGPFEQSTEEQWMALFDINLLHTLRATRAFLPGMLERGWGRVVNFSSVEGLRAMPEAAVYTAMKGAIDSFTLSLGVEVAGRGVRVNCVAVDKTRTEQVGYYDLGDEYEPMAKVWIPAGRYGQPEDVAKVVLFLSSELCDWVVGRTIPADGGTLAAGGWYPTRTKWTNSPLLVQWVEDDPTANDRRPARLR
jgi:NAD(P)-dependent dehydrogenase (short-subunit alcohol dehydrogenase family)